LRVDVSQQHVRPDVHQCRRRWAVRRSRRCRRLALIPERRIRQDLRQGRRHRNSRPSLQHPARPAGDARRLSARFVILAKEEPMSTSFSPLTPPPPVTSVREAETLTAHFLEVMDTLIDVVQRETDLVRAGRLAAATKLAEPKAELTRHYIADT